MLLGLKLTVLLLYTSGSLCFFNNNISWRRLKYTFTSPQGLLWMFYVMLYLVVGMARPDPALPVSSAMATLYAALGFLTWFALESAKLVSRVMRFTLTFFFALTLALAAYMSAYVWVRDSFSSSSSSSSSCSCSLFALN